MTPRILVTLSNEHLSVTPLFYAGELAMRLQAQMDVLFVVSNSKQDAEEEKFLKEIAPAIDNYREKGVLIKSYLAKGKFLEETAKFIKEIHPDIVVLSKLQQNFYSSVWLKIIREKLSGPLIVVVDHYLKKCRKKAFKADSNES